MRTMRPTRLAAELRELESRVASEVSASRLGPRSHRALRLELLRVLNGTAEFDRIPDAVPRTASLSDRIHRRIVDETDYALPKAIYEHAFFGASVDSAIGRRQVHRSEWAFASGLARTLSVPPSIGQDEAVEPPTWKIEVDESYQTTRVWLRELALQDMLLAGMEAFLVPAGSGRPSTETYGIVFGSSQVSAVADNGRTRQSHLDLNVERVCIQHRAKGYPSEVVADERSEVTQLAMGRELFPYWHLLGDFHTHTYRTLGEMAEVRGWEHSKYDELVNIDWCRRVRKLGHEPRVALILTLCRAARQQPGYQESWQGHANVIRANIGRCHCFISAYRIRPDGRYSTDAVTLKCPHLAGR